MTVGPQMEIGPGGVLGDGVRIGAFRKFAANVVIAASASLGNRVDVGVNSSIGGEPFLYVWHNEQWLKLPSSGSVDIADDVYIGRVMSP
jgi:UDP-3-O-[3-hydroxymyristoyl] glucosamine N-acyltransferase